MRKIPGTTARRLARLAMIAMLAAGTHGSTAGTPSAKRNDMQPISARGQHFATAADQAKRTGSVPIIVRLKSASENEEKENPAGADNLKAQQAVVELARSAGQVESVKNFQYLPIVAIRVDAAALKALENHPDVEDVQLDGLMAPNAAR